MIATVVNCLTVICGSFIGVLLSRRISAGLEEILYLCIGMISLVIGIRMSLEFSNTLFVVISLTAGGLSGYALDIDGAIGRFGSRLGRRFGGSGENAEHRFAQGFLNASILFCIGAMTFVGAIKAGASGDYELLLTKSVMDGISSVIFAAGLGIGVAFSVITILAVQGGITLLAIKFGDFIPQLLVSELSGFGGILIIMIGLNLLKIKDIKTANFLPGFVFLTVLFCIF